MYTVASCEAFSLFLCMWLTCLVLSGGQFIISFPKYISCKIPKGQVCLELRKCADQLPNGSPYINAMGVQQCGFYTCCNRTEAFSSYPQLPPDMIDQDEEDLWNEPTIFNRVFRKNQPKPQEMSPDKSFISRSCKSSMGERCIKLRHCPFFDTLIQNSPRPLPRAVFNIIRRHHCGAIENIPYVCCNATTDSLTPALKEKNDQATMTDAFSESLMMHPNYKMLPRNCGPVMTELLSSRITNGRTTGLNEFPWMALIAYRTDEDDGDAIFKCAGTLISNRFVLTAAHCILDSTIIGVRLGEYDVDKTEDCDKNTLYCAPLPQDIPIENIFVYPDYSRRGWKNDIAMIKLAVPANFTDNVQPICLPTKDVDLTGKFVTISGWGVTETGFQSSILRKAFVSVLKLSDCQKIFKKIPPTATQICAGGSGGVDSCAGDSGGPLKIEEKLGGTVRFVQHGIVSYGRRQCGTNGVPAIYTRLAKYMKWILDKLDT
ncbi:unnamed protein product [Phaedon cochleariae]|uniref:CLIP domain-containing serine protease n=1 Tax=Phaedon cochleariae TaxID=80249 RepID=A0A9P0GHK4_PHACE|nr:unnamed protein product [Phaedon cochleariae]